jgi:transglutaminase-like putative cysteine protease
MTKTNFVKFITLSAVIAVALFGFAPSADANSANFSNAEISVTSPSVSGLAVEGKVTVQGTSSLSKVWIAVKDPNGKTSSYPANVINGKFSTDIWFRTGLGSYTLWAGNNAKNFDGTIIFTVVNNASSNQDLLPSGYVDSDSPAVKAVLAKIIKDGMSEKEKLNAIHSWTAKNISYDYNAYLSGDNTMYKASETIARGIGMCRDYSFVVAALSRAAGLPAKVVYGYAKGSAGWADQKHAWNQVQVDGAWVNVDTTWDAGTIKGGKFVASYSKKYLAPDSRVFASSHAAENVTSF